MGFSRGTWEARGAPGPDQDPKASCDLGTRQDKPRTAKFTQKLTERKGEEQVPRGQPWHWAGAQHGPVPVTQPGRQLRLRSQPRPAEGSLRWIRKPSPGSWEAASRGADPVSQGGIPERKQLGTPNTPGRGPQACPGSRRRGPLDRCHAPGQLPSGPVLLTHALFSHGQATTQHTSCGPATV